MGESIISDLHLGSLQLNNGNKNFWVLCLQKINFHQILCWCNRENYVLGLKPGPTYSINQINKRVRGQQLWISRSEAALAQWPARLQPDTWEISTWLKITSVMQLVIVVLYIIRNLHIWIWNIIRIQIAPGPQYPGSRTEGPCQDLSPDHDLGSSTQSKFIIEQKLSIVNSVITCYIVIFNFNFDNFCFTVNSAGF